jgi:glutamate formiminotransferase/formiminotetrahydrofolate cyclodeaminase
MAEKGNPNSVSDAGVAALCARTAVKGAYLNVIINAQDLKEHPEVKPLVEKAIAMSEASDAREKEIMEIVISKIK